LVLTAPPGAGKSTRVPPAVVDELLPPTERLILLQPRRLAARSVAARIATERNCTLGKEVGYHVRFERRATRQTRLLVMTDGMFLRHLQDDPWLEGIGAVVFDEFHERNLYSDLALALCRRAQLEIRPELRLLVMSATLAAAPVAQYLGECAALDSPGQAFSVEIRLQRFADPRPAVEQIVAALPPLLAESTGHLLVFLPGVGEIKAVAREVGNYIAAHDVALHELYGDLPLEQQAAVLADSPRRKVILSTNVAETSLTIPGVTAVLDSGLARVLRQDPATGLNRLELERISQAAAAQRAGRAGRTAAGICVRLWTDNEHRALAVADTPEIHRVDLAGAALELLNSGEPSARNFPWYERPRDEVLRLALEQLRCLGAIDNDERITALGQRMIRLPLQPRLARLLIAGEEVGQTEAAALLAAMLAERDPFARNDRGPRREGNSRNRSGGHRAALHHSDSDLLDRLLALDEWERSPRGGTWLGALDHGAARHIFRARDQLLRQVAQESGASLPSSASLSSTATESNNSDADEMLLKIILAAFPDRVARRREPHGPRAIMVGGRGVKLAESSAVREAEFFVAVELQEIGGSEALVRLASSIEPAWLDLNLLTERTDLDYDPARERVVAWRRRKYLDLTLSEAQTNVPSDRSDEAAAILAAAVAASWEKILDRDEAVRQYELRLVSLRRWIPELDLPELDANFWQHLLPDLCVGCQSLAELRQRPLLQLLKQQLRPDQQQAVEREAPEKLTVPSGSRIALEYAADKPPVLAVRIQELFGLAQTPRIARGRVPVLLHLLGPNFRPQQVTDDLASFWKNTYPEVKKELRRRYPKHSWPDDPLTAPPQCKGGRRG